MWWKKNEKEGKYIFSISTGRSGSQYLAELLATAKDTVSFHEPEPKMHDIHLRMVEERGLEATYRERLIKIDAIKKAVRKSGASIYAETNHMFIKTFFDVVIKELNDVQVVFLRRNLVEILKSFYQLRYFTEENQAWKRWMTFPMSQNSAIKFVGNPTDEIDLSIGYIIDMYARAERFQAQHPEINVISFDISDFKNEASVLALFRALNLDPTDKTKAMVGTTVNARAERKQKYNVVADPIYLTTRVKGYLQILSAAGVSAPKSIIF